MGRVFVSNQWSRTLQQWIFLFESFGVRNQKQFRMLKKTVQKKNVPQNRNMIFHKRVSRGKFSSCYPPVRETFSQRRLFSSYIFFVRAERIVNWSVVKKMLQKASPVFRRFPVSKKRSRVILQWDGQRGSTYTTGTNIWTRHTNVPFLTSAIQNQFCGLGRARIRSFLMFFWNILISFDGGLNDVPILRYNS